jgi:hypothetical protein
MSGIDLRAAYQLDASGAIGPILRSMSRRDLTIFSELRIGLVRVQAPPPAPESPLLDRACFSFFVPLRGSAPVRASSCGCVDDRQRWRLRAANHASATFNPDGVHTLDSAVTNPRRLTTPLFIAIAFSIVENVQNSGVTIISSGPNERAPGILLADVAYVIIFCVGSVSRWVPTVVVSRVMFSPRTRSPRGDSFNPARLTDPVRLERMIHRRSASSR